MRVQDENARRMTAFIVVILLHVLILWWLALTREAALIAADPPIDLVLFSGSPPAGGDDAGGAASAAPSAVHVPTVVFKPFPDAFRAPPEPAPKPPEIVVGAAPTGAPVPAAGEAQAGAGAGAGQGVDNGAAAASGLGYGEGQGGAGTGVGTGAGAGAGSGASSGIRWIRQLTAAEKREIYPSLAARRRISGEAVILCRINRDTTVTHCRDESERPTGQGFGRAAVRAAQYMRIRPRVVNGVVQDGARERITVPFVWTQGVSPDDALDR